MEASLQERIRKDLQNAMKEKEELHKGVLRMVVASFERRATEKRTQGGDGTLSPEDELAVVRGEVKRRRESKELFEKGGRPDLAEKEARELGVLMEYLPPEMSREEISKAVKDAIAATGAASAKDFGAVMKEAMKALKGKADGAAVGAVIRELLP